MRTLEWFDLMELFSIFFLKGNFNATRILFRIIIKHLFILENLGETTQIENPEALQQFQTVPFTDEMLAIKVLGVCHRPSAAPFKFWEPCPRKGKNTIPFVVDKHVPHKEKQRRMENPCKDRAQ